ncbi:glycosyltransferase [Photobacterium damselae]|uniref:glycosyltransferase n=1 Tax=Photobacterium damselae TaxID=38293 RepID=UPI00159FB1E6|nr:glycosyltransferase [Photobacterium damselae]NVO60952.1 glycosyltransferase [Photobacterium damselae subsp. damselae]
MSNILINASNLHSGGGVQVATSFIYELSKLNVNDNIYIYVSTSVDENLKVLNLDKNVFFRYKVVNAYGLSSLKDNFKLFKGFDLIFTVFGPIYNYTFGAKNIVGFAQPWIIYPDNEISYQLNTLCKLKIKVKYLIQKIIFKKYDLLVVELEHVKKQLINTLNFEPQKIAVIYNCCSAIYKNHSFSIANNKIINIGYLARDYPHKNINILLDVKNILKVKYNMEVNFNVTLNDIEWGNKSDEFKSKITNLGELSVSECLDFYSINDAIIFPSFLECFSATPIESMAAGKVLFASNRGFIHDICKEYAIYIEPNDPENIAFKIMQYFTNQIDLDLDAARRHALNFSTPENRARSYLNLIKYELTKEDK